MESAAIPALIALACWLAYLPSAARVVQLTPDMVEYVDIARRLLAGEGYVLGIKAYHLGGAEVVHDGLIHRPPLYTFLVAGLLGLGFDLPFVQVVNAGFAAVSAATVCSIGTRLGGRVVGILAGILAAASPLAFEQQVPILTDALATALTLVAVRLVLTAVDRAGAGPDASGRAVVGPAAAAGVLFGLGYLTRPSVIVIWLGILAAVGVMTWRDRRLLRAGLGLILGAGVVCLPVTVLNLLARGKLAYSGKGYLYGVVSDADVMEYGFVTQPLGPLDFVAANTDFVVRAIVNMVLLYARTLFVEREGLGPLVLAWPAALFALARGAYGRGAWVVLAAAGANFLFYGLSWSIWQDRYMLTTLFLILPFAVDGLYRTAWPVAGLVRRVLPSARAGRYLPATLASLAVGAIVVVWAPRFVDQYRGAFRYGERPAGTRVDQGLRWTGPPRWVNDRSLEEALEWIAQRADRRDVLAHGQPWPYSFFSGRPSVLLPYRLDDRQLERFIVEYRVAYVLHDPRDPQRRDYLDQLRALAERGVRSTRVESLVVFDTRPLWQAP